MKTCRYCGETSDNVPFVKISKKHDGIKNLCRACHNYRSWCWRQGRTPEATPADDAGYSTTIKCVDCGKTVERKTSSSRCTECREAHPGYRRPTTDSIGPRCAGCYKHRPRESFVSRTGMTWKICKKCRVAKCAPRDKGPRHTEMRISRKPDHDRRSYLKHICITGQYENCRAVTMYVMQPSCRIKGMASIIARARPEVCSVLSEEQQADGWVCVLVYARTDAEGRPPRYKHGYPQYGGTSEVFRKWRAERGAKWQAAAYRRLTAPHEQRAARQKRRKRVKPLLQKGSENFWQALRLTSAIAGQECEQQQETRHG